MNAYLFEKQQMQSQNADLKKQLDTIMKSNSDMETELQKLMKDREVISASYSQLKQQSADKETLFNKEKSELEKQNEQYNNVINNQLNLIQQLKE